MIILLSALLSALLIVATLAHNSVSALLLSPNKSSRRRIQNYNNFVPNNRSTVYFIKQRNTYTSVKATKNGPPQPSITTQERAKQLIEENTLPFCNDDDEDCNPLDPYDEETVAPMESEFNNLMATFLTYSRTDIQSMTSTTNRYLNCNEIGGEYERNKQPKQRSKGEGIRYRALYSGVQAASMDSAVLRSFTVLFEDYVPIRLAGRRIYKHLNNVMQEVRLERSGEIERAKEACTGWDWAVKEDDGENHQHFIEYARCIWDNLMDEALLLDDSIQISEEENHERRAGFIPLEHLFQLGFGQILVRFQLVTDRNKVESVTKRIILEERNDRNTKQEHLDIEVDAISFVEFMRLLYHLVLTTTGSQITNNEKSVMKLLRTIKEITRSHWAKDASAILAATAIHRNSCQKRQKHSHQFDQYVSTFSVWENTFLNGDDAILSKQPSRRLEILRGCFSGAKNESVVAALKIVYMGKRMHTCC